MNKTVLLILSLGTLCLIILGVSSSKIRAETNAIARVWQARTTGEKANDYAKYLNEQLVTKITATDGNLGIQVLRRTQSDAVEFIVISYWESRDVLQQIYGENMDQASALPRDSEFLLEPATAVRHYDVVYSRYN